MPMTRSRVFPDSFGIASLQQPHLSPAVGPSWRARKSKHFDERDMETRLRSVLYAREVVVFPAAGWSGFFYRQRNCRIGPDAH